MASKSQIALPDLSERPRPEGKSASYRSTALQHPSPPSRRRGRRKPSKSKKADVIPAFLPSNDSEPRAEPESGAPEDGPQDSVTTPEPGKGGGESESTVQEVEDREHPARDDEKKATPRRASAAEDETSSDAGAASEVVASDGDRPDSANGGSLDDPELIALLEQLSATIDNANQVLSETPPLVGPVTKLYAPAGVPGVPEQTGPRAGKPVAGARIAANRAAFQAPEAPVIAPPPVSVEKRPGPAVSPAVLAAGLFLLAAVGAYWWFAAKPGLLDDWRSGDSSMLAFSRDRPAQSATARQSIGVKMPVPAVDVPLPPRKPEQEPTANEPQSGPASPAPLTEPPADEKSVPITEFQPESRLTAPSDGSTTSPVQGFAGQAIDLGLAVPPDKQGYEISVMIQGVPEGAELSKGSKIGGGTWILEEQDVPELALVTPASFKPRDFALEVAFVKSDGKIPESRTIDVVVEPVHAPVTPATHGLAAADAGKAPPAPATASVAARGPARGGTASQPSSEQAATAAVPAEQSDGATLTRAEEEQFLARGRDLLQLGDIASARLVLGHAARRGSRAAMLALGKTYDSQHLAELGVRGVKPDMNQANAWYERASRKADR